MNVFYEFKNSFKFVKKHPILLCLQILPISILILQALFVPATLNPFANHEIKKQDFAIAYLLNTLLFIASYATLAMQNIFAKDKKIKIKLALIRLPKLLIGGILISLIYILGAYLFMVPSIFAVALFMFYNQEIIFKNKSIMSAFIGSIQIFKNNIKTIINLLAILFGLSIINWAPYGIIINYIIQPCVNVTIAKVYLKKFM